MQQHPPGWYPNPVDAAQLRWWDGTTWTDHTAPLSSAQSGWQSGWDTPPPQRKRRIWPWIVFPAVGLFVIFGVSAAIFVPRIVGEFKHPIDAANVYLGDIRNGRLQDAYAHACILRYGGTSYEQFVALRQSDEARNGRLLKFNAHQVHRVSGRSNEAIVDIDLTTTQGRFPIQADMIREDGHWHWCTYRRVPS